MGKPNFVQSGLLIVSMFLTGMAAEEALAQPKQSKLKSVMVLEHGAGAGDRASCDHLNALLREHGTAHGFTVNVLAQDANLDSAFSAEHLAKYQVVILAYNNGVHRFIQGTARNEFEKYVEKGGGLLAINFASAFIDSWPWIDSVLVQKFYGPHQNFGPAADLKLDAEGLELGAETRGILKDLTAPTGFIDAFIQFRTTPRGSPGVTVLLTVDEKSATQPFNSPMGEDHPVAWAKTVEKGRVVHNSLGFSFEGRSHNVYTQKGNFLKNFTYTSLRYAAGDFIGCMDDKFEEFNSDATKSDPAQCLTLTTSLIRFNHNRNQKGLPLVFQDEAGTLIHVEFYKPGPNSITIADIAGKRVYQKTGSGQARYSVPTPIKSGIYIVKAMAGGKASTHRVTVL